MCLDSQWIKHGLPLATSATYSIHLCSLVRKQMKRLNSMGPLPRAVRTAPTALRASTYVQTKDWSLNVHDSIVQAFPTQQNPFFPITEPPCCLWKWGLILGQRAEEIFLLRHVYEGKQGGLGKTVIPLGKGRHNWWVKVKCCSECSLAPWCNPQQLFQPKTISSLAESERNKVSGLPIVSKMLGAVFKNVRL